MESRKIQVVGNRSFAVSLPKNWIEQNKIKNHDPVFMHISSNNEIVISKINLKKKDLKTVIARINSHSSLTEFIVFCYTKNVDKIILTSSSFDYKVHEIVIKTLNFLEGYEITSEDENKIEITFLFNEVNVSLPMIILRMFYLMKIHLSALKTKDSQGIQQAESSVDRLYHLGVRVIFSCMEDHSKRIPNGINSEEDLFYTRVIIKRLESISDNLCRMISRKLSSKEIAHIEKILDVLGELTGSKHKPSTLKEKIEDLTPSLAEEKANFELKRVYDLVKDIFDIRISQEFNEKIDKEEILHI